MKALSVRSPWWWFILHGSKDIENRDWPTNYRGTIYLHASKWWHPNDILDDAFDANFLVMPSRNRLGRDALAAMKDSGGCLVGQVDIVDCVSHSSSRWFSGKYGFVLANPVARDVPVPCKGALGFFEVPESVVHSC